MNDANKRLFLAVGLIILIGLLAIQGITWVEATVTQWEAKAKAQETIRREVAALAEQLKASRGAGKGSPTKNSGTDAIDSLLPWLEKETAAFQLTDKMQQIAP
ncbi:MAG: hypothetical protein HQL94_09480, partial [Magnetococcales bacterium]|nr:hypothetical protein [Magnetococcales bacterium]